MCVVKIRMKILIEVAATWSETHYRKYNKYLQVKIQDARKWLMECSPLLTRLKWNGVRTHSPPAHVTFKTKCLAQTVNGPNHLNPFCAHFNAKTIYLLTWSLIHIFQFPRMTFSLLFVHVLQCIRSVFDMSNAANECHTQCSRSLYYLNAVFCVFICTFCLHNNTRTSRYTLDTHFSVYDMPWNIRPCVYNRWIANIIEKQKHTSTAYSISVFSLSISRFLVCLLLLRFSWIHIGTLISLSAVWHTHDYRFISLHFVEWACATNTSHSNIKRKSLRSA